VTVRLPDKIIVPVPVSGKQRCPNRAACCPARWYGAEFIAQRQDVGAQRTVVLFVLVPFEGIA